MKSKNYLDHLSDSSSNASDYASDTTSDYVSDKTTSAKSSNKVPGMFQTATIPPTAQIDNKSTALQALELLTVVNQADLSTSYTR